MATNGAWNGGTGDWDTSSNWQNNIEPSVDGNASATAGTIIVTNDDSVGGLSFSGSVGLEVNGGILDVAGNGNDNGTVNLDLGSGGAVVGQNSVLEVEDSFNGTASGTVYLEGASSAFYWQPQLSDYPGPATVANSTNLTVDFNDGGQAATFGLSAAFDGKIAGFQSGDYISWAFATGENDSYTATFGNNTVTLTDNEDNSVTINFVGTSNQYNSSDLVVTDGYLLTTTYVPPAPEVGSATYDASTGKLVVTAAGNGDNFTTSAGDFDPTQLSLTGENGLQYTLTGGVVSNVSSTSFTVTLTSADQLQVDGLFDNNGSSSTGNDIFNGGQGPTTYQIDAGASFDVGGRASSGGVTVSNALTPTISSVSYNRSTGVLSLTGTGFEDVGGFGGIHLGQITLENNSGGSFTFNAEDYGSATSATQATIDLSNTTASYQQAVQPGEEAAVNAFFGASGPFTLAATSGWDAGAGAAITSQNVTLVGVVATITSETDSSPSGADIDANKTVTFTVNFSAAVTATGSPELTLTGGRTASLTSGSGTSALVFSYTVQPGDNVADLEATAFNLNNGTIQNGGVNADLSGFTTINTGVQLDTTPPSARSIARASSSLNNASRESYTVTFSESVTGVDASDFTAATTGTIADTGITVTPISGRVYRVTVNGVTGDGTLGLDLNSSGTGIADAAGNAISGGFAGQTYTIDHTPPVVAFGAKPSSFDGTHATLFSGTASDGSGIASARIYNGAINTADLIGAATVDGGVWSLSTTLAAGLYNRLRVVVTDGAGNTSTAAAPYVLQTGIVGRKYTALESNYVGGALASQTFFNSDGSTYLASTIAPDGHGGHDYTYTGGSYFTGKAFRSFEQDYNSTHDPIALTYFNGDGSTYLAGTVASDGHGGHDYTFTRGSFFTGKAFRSYEQDYNSNNDPIALTYFNSDGSTYLADTIAPDGHGGRDYTYTGGSYFTGKAFRSYEQDYNSTHDPIALTYFNGDGSTYLAGTIASDGHGGHDYTYTGGSYFTGKTFTSFENDLDSAGHLAEQIFHNTNGSRTIRGCDSGLTLTSEVGDTTFLFIGAFGDETVSGFGAHLTGAGHDTISIPSFADIRALLAATHDVSGNAVIDVSAGDHITLLGVDKATIAAHPTDFHLGA